MGHPVGLVICAERGSFIQQMVVSSSSNAEFISSFSINFFTLLKWMDLTLFIFYLKHSHALVVGVLVDKVMNIMLELASPKEMVSFHTK